MARVTISRAIFFGAVTTVLAACTIISGAGDLVADGVGGDGGPGSDPLVDGQVAADGDSVDGGGGSFLGNVDATVVDACGTTGCEVLPEGFQLVAFGAFGAAGAQDAGCPTGFAQPVDGVEQPTLSPGACTCGCNVAAQPTCTLAGGNTINLFYGPVGSGSCPSTGQSLQSGCSTDGFLGPFIAYDRNYQAPAASLTGGTCNSNTTKDDTKLRVERDRVCQATVLPQCEGKTCLPTNVAPFSACVAATGARQCPTGWPNRHLVGASASFTCGGGCTCNVQGSCSTAGTLSYFSSANCSGAAGLTYGVDGGCNQTGGTNNSFGSHRYDPNPPTNVRCQAGGASTPSAPALAQETTVCCR